MAITAQDIIDNAELIATVVNGSTGKTINQLTEDAAPVAADLVHGWDASLGEDRKVQMGNLPGGGGGGGAPIALPAETWRFPTTLLAPLDTQVGSNQRMKTLTYDDVTEWKAENKIYIPDVSSLTTAHFVAVGVPATPAASRYIQLKLYHAKAGSTESWDIAGGSESSTDHEVVAAGTGLDYVSWNQTLATLGWGTRDQVLLNLSRIAPVGTNLSGYWYCSGMIIYFT